MGADDQHIARLSLQLGRRADLRWILISPELPQTKKPRHHPGLFLYLHRPKDCDRDYAIPLLLQVNERATLAT
jgi:hypothetical protein